MINYIEKGAGLHAALRAAGLHLRDENGTWIADDEAAVQAIIDAFSVADAAAYVCQDIEAEAKRLRDKAIKAISPGEMAGWPIKLAEAAKFSVSGDPADAPLLAAESAARGIDLPAMMVKVQSNAGGFAALEAQIGGTSGRHRDAVRALDTFEAIAAYDWSAGWPAV